MKRLLVLPLLLPLALGGCEYWLIGTAATADNLTRDATGVSLVDRALDDWTGLECRTVNLQFGKPVCREPILPSGPYVYCYRSLANPECFTMPDPSGRPNTRLGAAQTGQPR